jgi:cyclopropane-fatty-acyl-phospholipid synthase
MSEFAINTAPSVWETPDFRGAPAAFRTAMKVLKTNWQAGHLDVVMPGGRRLSFSGSEPGPSAEMIVRDYRPLHGDRNFRDDSAIMTGLGRIGAP